MGDREVTLSLVGQAERSGSLDSVDDLTVRISDAAFGKKPSTGAREYTFKVTFDGATLRAERMQLLAAAARSVDTTVAFTLSGAAFTGRLGRSEERRVGKVWVRTSRSRWSPYP